ncbi:MAG: T9SS type A sorting domain-containing protein [Cytophagales bacterium]
MRRIPYILVLFFLPLSIFAQSSYELSFDVQKQANELKIDYYIQKISGADFALGSSNLPLIKGASKDIDWSQIQVDNSYISPFSAASDPNSYKPLIIADGPYVNLTILTRYAGSGNGFIVSGNLLKVASLKIPLTGNCPEANLSWETSSGAINAFTNNGNPSTIKSGAIFKNQPNSHLILFDIPNQPQIHQAGTGILSACVGKSVTLETSASNFDMQWFKDGIELGGAMDSVLNASASGLYAVQLSNCSVSEMSDPVEVDIIPLPQKASITENDGILYSSVGGNIQWYHNGQPIAGANSEDLIPSNSGIYTVKSFNSCGEIFSDPYNYAPLGVDLAQNGTYLHVFPNPYIGKTNIEVTLSKETELTIEVYDLKGNLVSLVDEGVFDSGKHQLRFSAQELGYAAGTYVLKVRTNEKELIHNLIELK